MTDVACTCKRSPIFDSGSAPARLNDSSTRASYRLNVIPKGRNTASSWPSRICCARMIEVTARIAAKTSASSSGQDVSHSSPARPIGSNGSGLGTAEG